jgi:hypothetical protein
MMKQDFLVLDMAAARKGAPLTIYKQNDDVFAVATDVVSAEKALEATGGDTECVFKTVSSVSLLQEAGQMTLSAEQAKTTFLGDMNDLARAHLQKNNLG